MVDQNGHVGKAKALQRISKVNDIAAICFSEMLDDRAVFGTFYGLKNDKCESLYLVGRFVVILFQNLLDCSICKLALVLGQFFQSAGDRFLQASMRHPHFHTVCRAESLNQICLHEGDDL